MQAPAAVTGGQGGQRRQGSGWPSCASKGPTSLIAVKTTSAMILRIERRLLGNLALSRAWGVRVVLR